MRNVLITGASGFVGAHLARGLGERGWEVFAVGGVSAVEPVTARLCRAAPQCNLSDAAATERLLRETNPTYIIHAAALARVADCERNPAAAEEHNVLTTENILRAMGRRELFYLSTDLVFDGNGMPPAEGFSEDDTPRPASVYAKTKYAAECAVLGAGGRVLRLPLVYGAPAGKKGGVLGWLLDSLRSADPVRLFVDEWRTPIFVDDIAATCDILFQLGSALPPVLHLGGPERLSRYEFGEVTCQVFGFDRVLLVPTRQSELDTGSPRARDASLAGRQVEGLLGKKLKSPERGLEIIRDEQMNS